LVFLIPNFPALIMPEPPQSSTNELSQRAVARQMRHAPDSNPLKDRQIELAAVRRRGPRQSPPICQSSAVVGCLLKN
jgi:hypothetical protein